MILLHDTVAVLLIVDMITYCSTFDCEIIEFCIWVNFVFGDDNILQCFVKF